MSDTPRKFEREIRYQVIKLKTGKPVDCVVVERDWPEYEIVWAMIQDRMNGLPNKIDALERELAAANAKIAALRKDAEYADLLRWAESHPEIAYNSITSWWAQAGRGCREREFMFSNCIKGAKRGVD